MPKQIIAVMGATGAQGGGVVQALLEQGSFAVRAVTRNIESSKAKALQAAGAEVVQADADDVDSLKEAFQDAYGAFFVSNFYEHMSAAREIQQLKNMADAAAAAGVQHVVMSSLEDTRPLVKEGTIPKLDGQYYVPHFDSKGEAAIYVAKTVPCTILLTSFYYENFIRFGMGPKPGRDGKLELTLPMGDALLPMQAVNDIGKFAAKLFERKDLIAQTVAVAGNIQTMSQVAETFSRVLDKPVVYNAVEPSEYAQFGFPAAAELANMFQFKRDYNAQFVEPRRLDKVRTILSDVQSFESWLMENKDAFNV